MTLPAFFTDEHHHCATLASPEPLSTPPSAADLSLDAETPTTWRGFGACFNELGWRALGHLDPAARGRLLDAFFRPDGDLRLRHCRLPIGANDYSLDWYSLADTPGDFELAHFSLERDRRHLIPYIKEALARQPALTLFASPWSPPAWLKNPPVYNYGKLIADERHLDTYARYFVKFVQAYAAEGIRIDEIHVQNEPVSTQKFPSCVITGAEFAHFIGRHLGPAFERAGLSAQIWLGTINGPETDDRKWWSTFNDYAFTVLEDREASRHVRGISYQWAGKYAVWRTRLAYPELPLIQTENECGDGNNTWQYAWYVADLVQHYLVQDASAYVYWNPVLEPGGESTWGWRQNAMVTIDPATRAVTLNPEYQIFRHYAASIPVGARRIACSRPWAANALAYRLPDGSASLVVRNPFAAARPFTFSRSGRAWRGTLPARSLATFTLPPP